MYLDDEREGGICTSAGDTGVGAYADGGVEAVAEVGGGSLATLDSGGAMIGEEDGDCADCGADAVAVRVGPGPGPDAAEKELADDAAAEETAPVSSETNLSEMGLPEKNSPDVREGSIEGAGGNMSDWNESDFSVRLSIMWGGEGSGELTLRGTMNAIGSMEFVVSLYALAISHSEVLSARRGTKHIPRCGSLDLCSSNAYRLSLSYS
jgi:hypothetical protein